MIRAESWSLCIKLAAQLGRACLVPDCMPTKPLTRLRTTGFKYPYQVTLLHLRPEKLSEAEIHFIEMLKLLVPKN